MANEGRPEDTEFMTREEREEIRRRVGDGNFESAKDDSQTGSINS